jgi:hypothetical protein
VETFDILARHVKLKAYTDKLKFDNVLKKTKKQYALQFWLIIYLNVFKNILTISVKIRFIITQALVLFKKYMPLAYIF